ncbi:nucleotidyltransferase and HEPN domain-containing protein [Ochrobactrum sp. MYb379]|uniref:nucleotidyltransferase and HEPN domain-containing protein n=1 Tax=Ochrobactrum sp. MYb379 TaxID=2745275 RepID=UPI0030979BE9
MKSSIEHLPLAKQEELHRTVQILLEELEDALKPGSAEFKKRGRILKIILFGSYARGDWVDEPHTSKGYQSDFDLLIIVNDRRLTEFSTYWNKADDRLIHAQDLKTPVKFIVHSRREINNALKQGQYFFVDIRRQGIVLYQLDDEPLAEPRPISDRDAYRIAKDYFEDRLPHARFFVKAARMGIEENSLKEAAFLFHQAIEQAYSGLLLTLTNYTPASHNIKFLRSIAESQAPSLADVWPRDQQRYSAWFNVVNEAYVKARYSKHFEISQEALEWLSARTQKLIDEVDIICRDHLLKLSQTAEGPRANAEITDMSRR